MCEINKVAHKIFIIVETAEHFLFTDCVVLVNCVVLCIICVNSVVLCIVCVQMCSVLLPLGVNPIAVNKCIMSLLYCSDVSC